MSIRTDVVIDWNVSPRVITVLEGGASDAEITLQDLTDTIASLEASPEGMSYDFIISSSGKEALGGGVSVGITLQMNSAVLGFAARSGPGFVQCNISGGNLTAIDDIGDPLNPVQTTAYTQIIRTSSSSATLQDLEAIQYASFQDSVWINIYSTQVGVAYPSGNSEYPVNNLTDAVAIAEERGFTKLQFTSEYTFDASVFIAGYKLIGNGMQTTTFTFEAGSVVAYCEVYNAKVTGLMIGITAIIDCYISTLGSLGVAPSSQDIIIKNCLIDGVLSVPSNYSGIVKVLDCWADAVGIANPALDWNGSTSNIIISNFSGGVNFRNITQGNDIIVNLNTGVVILEDTVTDANIIIRGTGGLTDNSGDGVSVNSDGLTSPFLTAEAVWDAILTGDTHNIPTSAGRRLRELAGNIITAGTAQSGSTNNTIILNGNASTVDGSYDPSMIAIVGGKGMGQSRGIFQYAGSIRTAVVDRNWKIIPDDTSEYVIYGWPGREHVNEGLARGGTSDTIILNTLGSIHDGAYANQLVFIRSGTGEDQVGVVKSYIGSTRTAKIYDPWEIIPDTTSAYVMIPNHIHPEGTAKAVWDLIPSIPITGSFGEFIINLWDEAGGDRKIDEDTNQEIFYKAGGGAEVMRFDLFDINGNPASQNIYKRVRV